jgi:hypothetical protein
MCALEAQLACSYEKSDLQYGFQDRGEIDFRLKARDIKDNYREIPATQLLV